MLLCTFCFVIVLFVSYVIACPDDWFFIGTGCVETFCRDRHGGSYAWRS